MIRGLRFTQRSYKGGPGSGHHGHAGIPGQVGGSVPGGQGDLTALTGNKGADGSFKAEIWMDSPVGRKGYQDATDVQRAKLKAKVARKLAKEAEVSEEKASNFISQWAGTSNDNLQALSVQRDASEEFKIELSEFNQEKIKGLSGGLGIDAFMPPAKSLTQRTLLRVTYNETQAKLKKWGIKEVRLHRGVTFDTPLKVREGKHTSIRTNVLSSWSINADVAQEFAKRGGNGVVFSSVVPANRIFSFPMTGLGCLTEGEVVILGGKNDIGTVSWNYGL